MLLATDALLDELRRLLETAVLLDELGKLLETATLLDELGALLDTAALLDSGGITTMSLLEEALASMLLLKLLTCTALDWVTTEELLVSTLLEATLASTALLAALDKDELTALLDTTAAELWTLLVGGIGRPELPPLPPPQAPSRLLIATPIKSFEVCINVST